MFKLQEGKSVAVGETFYSSWEPWWDVPPTRKETSYKGIEINTNQCCGTAWNMEINFCPKCGKKLNSFNPFTGKKIVKCNTL